MVVTYCWPDGAGYVLSAVVPSATRICATLRDRAPDVLNALPADTILFVFHVDLTVSARVPIMRRQLLRELAARGVATLNANITDISKRAVHRCCLRAGLESLEAPRNGAAQELLIVKTNYNYGGLREASLDPYSIRRLGCDRGLRKFLRGYKGYLVAARAALCDSAWTSPHLVVERYVTNREHLFYRVYVAGTAIVVSRVRDPALFKKMPIGIARESYFFSAPTHSAERIPFDDGVEMLGSSPGDARLAADVAARFAREARMDFGALDIVSDDEGRLFIVDANVTPYWGAGGHLDILEFLGGGVGPLARSPTGDENLTA